MEIFLNLTNSYEKKSYNESERYISLKEFPSNIDIYETPSDFYLQKKQNLEKKPYRIRTNNDGFLVGEDNLLSNDKVEIIFFGGSTTLCRYVDENKRFPYVVQKNLNDKLANNIQVLNSAFTGKTSKLSFLDLVSKGVKYRPKVVVLMHNVNDLSLLQKTGSYDDAPKTRRLINYFYSQNPNNVIQRLFPNTYRGLYIVKESIFSKTTSNPNDEWKKYRDNAIIDNKILSDEFYKSITSFVTYAKNYNINVVLMTQFNRMKMDDKFVLETFYERGNDNAIEEDYIVNTMKSYREFNEIIRKIAEEQNKGIIDLDRLVPKNKDYIIDRVHVNNVGSELVGSIISDYIYTKYFKND